MAQAEGVELSSLLTTDTSDVEQNVPRRPLLRPLVAGVATLALGLVFVAGVSSMHNKQPSQAETSKTISKALYNTPMIPNPYSGGMPAPPQIPAGAPPQAQPAAQVPYVAQPTSIPVLPTAAGAAAPVITAPAIQQNCAEETPSARSNPNKRSEALNDGNICRDTEEVFGGLCYRKCSLFPGFLCSAKRMSAFQCCGRVGMNEDCSDPLSFVAGAVTDIDSVVPCTGFDVSSANAKTTGQFACPHEPGACMENEEQNMGLCFEKCSLLTNGEYPYRCAPDTCATAAAAADLTACVTDSKTSGTFAAGGGKGDGDKSTPAKAHYPLEDETEKTAVNGR